jgi:quercetin dioxygenase-like cupin family protein
MNELDKLEVLTEELPTLKDLAIIKQGVIEYDVGDGTLLGFGLWHEPAVGVQRAFTSKGTVLARHMHDEREWLIVYKGRLEVDYCGETIEVGEGDFVFFESHTAHLVKALKDTWLLGVTVPVAEGYPNVNKQRE